MGYLTIPIVLAVIQIIFAVNLINAKVRGKFIFWSHWGVFTRKKKERLDVHDDPTGYLLMYYFHIIVVSLLLPLIVMVLVISSRR